MPPTCEWGWELRRRMRILSNFQTKWGLSQRHHWKWVGGIAPNVGFMRMVGGGWAIQSPYNYNYYCVCVWRGEGWCWAVWGVGVRKWCERIKESSLSSSSHGKVKCQNFQYNACSILFQAKVCSCFVPIMWSMKYDLIPSNTVYLSSIQPFEKLGILFSFWRFDLTLALALALACAISLVKNGVGRRLVIAFINHHLIIPLQLKGWITVQGSVL